MPLAATTPILFDHSARKMAETTMGVMLRCITFRALLSAINTSSIAKGVSNTRRRSLIKSERFAQPEALKMPGHATGSDGSKMLKRPSIHNMSSLTIRMRGIGASMGHGSSISLKGSGVAALTM